MFNFFKKTECFQIIVALFYASIYRIGPWLPRAILYSIKKSSLDLLRRLSKTLDGDKHILNIDSTTDRFGGHYLGASQYIHLKWIKIVS